MNSLPSELVSLILDYIPNIMIMRINKKFETLVTKHEDYTVWTSYTTDKIYKYGKAKMVDSNYVQINQSKLEIACEYGNLDITKYLVSLNVDVHMNNDYTVRIASENGHLNVVQYLVSINADVYASDNCALVYVSNNGHLEVVKYLVSVDANSNDALKWAIKKGHTQIVEYLTISKRPFAN